MPTYSARCNNCDGIVEYTRRIQDRWDTPTCECGGITQVVIIKAPMGFVKGNDSAFRSPVDGSIINSQRALREHNARNNVVNLHDGYDEATIVAGAFGNKGVANVKPDPKDIAKDIYEAYQRVDNGYKPVIGVDEDA